MSGSHRSTLTEAISIAVATLRFEDIPTPVIDKAKMLIADTLAVAWAGRNAAGSPAVEALALNEGGREEATLWATGKRLPAASATFVNAFHAAALDYDSLNGNVHADIVTLPAAFALAERQHASGRDFLTAYIAGAELMIRLGRATQKSSKGWSATSIYGGFASATASARLLGLDAEGIQNALGISLGQAAGTQQANVEQVLLKRLQPALAARAGVFSAQLAQAGISGPAEALEGRFGLQSLYLPFDEQVLLGGFGRDFLFTETGLKKYPVCACSHPPMDALLDLVTEHDLKPEQILSVNAEISPFMARLVGNPDALGADPQVVAQFSLRYALASIILRRRLGLAEITADAVSDPLITDISKNITVEIDETLTGNYGPARVEVRTVDGRQLTQIVTTLPGSDELPLSDSAVHRRLSDCGGWAEPSLDIDQLRASIEGLDGPEALFQRVVPNNFRMGN
ncbi:MmgE/PrpD family protein [Rhizobium rhizogenes]|uniref:MmgE/PrpD family protein n=1 Tax=Rhizobium rhizogenes TaxID=359 RepID=UPI0015730F83|nr:MmgE/PrpD family protein [Rhizobium rhizogenes]NTI78457.1 MmgE/PrpD family protein [Rhizobium rhizogenes]